MLVVGAHWDTVTNTGGLDDNGSGVAAMLELGKQHFNNGPLEIRRYLI